MEPERPARPLAWKRIAAWQLAQVVLVAVTFRILGRGSLLGLAAGAAILLASLLLSRLAFAIALRPDGHPALAVGLFLAKLGGLLVLAFLGLRGALVGPMSFAVGATTLPVAIFLDTCYQHRRNRPTALHAD